MERKILYIGGLFGKAIIIYSNIKGEKLFELLKKRDGGFDALIYPSIPPKIKHSLSSFSARLH